MIGHDTTPLKKKIGDLLDMSRRTFLKLSGIVCASTVISYLILKPKIKTGATAYESEGIPIKERWLPTSCLNCSSRCAIRVRVTNGRAVKISGNPLSKTSEGGICPRAHIGLQVLYDKERLHRPLMRTNPKKGRGIDPGWTEISWDFASNEITKRLRSLRIRGLPHRLMLLYGLNATSDEDMIRHFANAYGTPNVISGSSLDSESEKSGGWMADGNYACCAYDMGETNYILSFGADFLESQKPLSRWLRMWGKIRRERPIRAKVVAIDPRYSVTASMADEWIPINPGTHGLLAMGLAHVIISEGLCDRSFVGKWTAGFDEYKGLTLKDYGLERVSKKTGIAVDVILRIAREFAKSKPAIAWRGRGATAWPNGSYTSYAIFCLNALVGSIDVPGGVIYQENPRYRGIPKPVEDDIALKGNSRPAIDLRKTMQFPCAEVVTNQVPDSILNNDPYPIEMAMGFNSNFNMSAPRTSRWDNALKKIPYYVHIAPFMSEMAHYADIVLPAPTFLEQWAYDQSPPGAGFAEVQIRQPVVKPIHHTRSIIDIIFELSRRLGEGVARSFDHIGEDAKGFVRYRTSALMPWDEFTKKGVWVGSRYEYHKYDRIFKTSSKKFEFRSSNLGALLREIGTEDGDGLSCLPHYQEVEFLGDQKAYPLIMLPYQPLLTMENGSQNYPWAQQIFLVMHGIGWANLVELSNTTARELGIKSGDMVWVESEYDKIKAQAKVFEGIHPQVVSISFGQGHYAHGRWQKGIGVNPNEIIGVDYDHLSGQTAFFNTRVKVYKA
jgi:anaerobic selenocysteine-containing dehydrogenase